MPTLQQVAAVLTANGRSAAATCGITLVHAGYALYFTLVHNGPEDAPQNCPRLLIHGFLVTPEPMPKRHLDRFSLCSTAHGCNERTQTTQTTLHL